LQNVTIDQFDRFEMRIIADVNAAYAIISLILIKNSFSLFLNAKR